MATSITETEAISGTIRVGDGVSGAGVAPGTVITGYIPTESPLTTHFTVKKAAGTSVGINDWQFVGTQFRTHFEPVTTALSDLIFSNYGFSLPSTAINIGITVSSLNISQFPTTSVVSQVSLWNSGGQLGTIKTPNTPFTTSLVTDSYGGATDSWGATLTPAVVNDPSFGFAEAVATDTSRVFVGEPFYITVDYDVVTLVPSSQPGGAGQYTVNNAQTTPNELLQTASSGKSRLAPFQFSTAQGAILEFSAGIIRIWEGATQGSWSLGLALSTPPSGVNYNPATAYAAGNIALVGPWAALLNYTRNAGPPVTYTPNPSLGVLTIAAPYGTSFGGPVFITVTTNSSNALSVTAQGISPNQSINIALANTTPANNAASLIQAAIRALVSLNAAGSNFVDLTGWTVTPDPIYNSTPWIVAPTIAPGAEKAVGVNASFVAQCVGANIGDQFPVMFDGSFNSLYWTSYNATAQLPIELVTPYPGRQTCSRWTVLPRARTFCGCFIPATRLLSSNASGRTRGPTARPFRASSRGSLLTAGRWAW